MDLPKPPLQNPLQLSQHSLEPPGATQESFLQPAKNLLNPPQDLSRTHRPGALPALASPPLDLPKPVWNLLLSYFVTFLEARWRVRSFAALCIYIYIYISATAPCAYGVRKPLRVSATLYYSLLSTPFPTSRTSYSLRDLKSSALRSPSPPQTLLSG
jgi:hypothetical protein